ncbi:hypothetical protein OV208_05405 [Corallococcus sp. bb12-1]|uniref:hypothetical protein n=1 Tax=Corallococcus sp. bb12-1 TaxID=2996784 RepID=UPI002271778C|nr:hypothetical protein [Corallococcus sp. bb12-1]MCY1040753.1 hypothetical protein [Corallococcus sp. bb12-1]
MRIDLLSLCQRSEEAIPWLLSRLDLTGGRQETLQGFEGVSLHFHTLAAGALLVEGSPSRFREELHNAASHWLRFLKHQRARQWAAPAISRNKPLLGAILAGHWELAHQLAETSPDRWQEKEEYEDDACWAQILQQLVLTHGGRGPRLDTLLARLGVLGGELNEHRQSWVRGLLSREGLALNDSFSALCVLHQEDIERQVQALTASEPKLAPYRFLWFEGLALLRIWERTGLPGPCEAHPYCPPMARLPLENQGSKPPAAEAHNAER